MKKRVFLIFVILFSPIFVYADTAHSTVVMDVNSGRVLYEKKANEKRLIASITKIMTCIIVLENVNVEDELVVGDEVLSMYGTNIYIEPGEKMKIIDLLYGMMLRSGNDAAITLATNTLGYDKFINKMNEKARNIGMFNTEFQNPHGLDDDTQNVSTAYDMALLSQYVYKNKIYRKIVSTKKYKAKSSLKSYTWYNRMGLINGYNRCVGGKNGYTPRAGKTLVSYAKKDGLVLTIVSLDDNSIYENHKDLYEYYFSVYKNYLIVDKRTFKFKTYFQDKNIFIKNDFIYPLNKEETDRVVCMVKIYPKTRDGKAGQMQVSLDDEVLGNIDLYTKSNKKKKDLSVFQKFIRLFIR